MRAFGLFKKKRSVRMKFVCTKENLLKSINIVSRAVPVRTTMDILKCILIQAEDQELTLTANDTSLGIETKTDAVIYEPGLIAIDASLFSSIIRKLPDSDVKIETDASGSIQIECEKASFNISGRGTDDFIYLPSVDVISSVTLSQFTLKEMINQVIFSVADSDMNTAMSGVYVEVFDGKIRMTALDGHRIAVRVNELKENFDPSSLIIPGKTLSDLSKIIVGDSTQEMTLSFGRNHVVFEYDRTRMVSRIIEGDYFRIESMLRETHETSLRINKKILLECLDRSTLLINESDKKPVIMDITNEEIRLKLKSGIGSMNEVLPIQKTGKDLKIAFNPKLLMDALRVIDDEEITMYMVKYNYPCTIRDEEGSYSYIVLPVNFSED